MKTLFLAVIAAATMFGQQVIRFSATTGDVVLSGAGTTATLQQPATNAGQVQLETVVVYCSVACNITQAANGTGATTTAGTVTPVLPSQLNLAVPVNFFTASNVGAGTAQGGIFHLTGAGTQVFCLNVSCGATSTVALPTFGIGSNYSITVSTITGTANITVYGRYLN
jgi:hypothetical protein